MFFYLHLFLSDGSFKKDEPPKLTPLPLNSGGAVGQVNSPAHETSPHGRLCGPPQLKRQKVAPSPVNGPCLASTSKVMISLIRSLTLPGEGMRLLTSVNDLGKGVSTCQCLTMFVIASRLYMPTPGFSAGRMVLNSKIGALSYGFEYSRLTPQ
jgi:hypothetical protein